MSHIVTRRAAYTLIEVILAITIVAILVGLAVPQLRRQIAGFYVRAALNQLAAEVYRTRMTAVRNGGPARLVLHRDSDGCVRQFSLRVDGVPTDSLPRGRLTLPALCLRHSGDSVLTFNSRGMLRPPTRSFHVSYGGRADSVLLSIAGRVRRNYRRRRP